MAYEYTQILRQGSNGIQLQIDHGDMVDAVTLGPITPSTTKVKLNGLAIYIATTSVALTDTDFTVGWSGSLLIQNNNLPNLSVSLGVNSRKLITTLSLREHNISYGVTGGATFAAGVSGLEKAGVMDGSRTFAIPARPYSVPGVPVTKLLFGSATVSGQQNDTKQNGYWEKQTWQLSTNGGSFASWRNNLPGNTHTQNFTMAANSSYRFRARAENATGAGSWGTSGTYYTQPAAPSGLSATQVAGTTNVDLKWTNNARYGDQVEIWSGSTKLATVSGSTTTYRTTVPFNTTKSFFVKTLTPAMSWVTPTRATSNASNTASVTMKYLAPAAPTSVKLTLGTAGIATIAITGNVTSNTNSKYWENVEYAIVKDSGSYGTTVSLAGSTTSIALTSLAVNSRYKVRARSKNSGGVSGWVESGYIYTTPLTPTLTGTRGDTGVVLTAKANAAWHNSFQLLRSVGGGALIPIADDTKTSYTDAPDHSKSVRYELVSLTPTPTTRSAAAVLEFPIHIPTDKTKIPGVTKIYHGASRVRVVRTSTANIWTDGEE